MTRTKPATETPRGEEIGLLENGTPAWQARPGETTDALGRPLSAEDAEIFRAVQHLQRAVVHADEFVDRLLTRWPGFDAAYVRYRLGLATDAIGATAPYCVCPSCSGRGQRRGKHCVTCDGKRLLTLTQFRTLSADLREVAEGFKS